MCVHCFSFSFPRVLPSHSHALCCAQTKPALDFTEDPFKDYRYEDPFNIEDPFGDVPATAPRAVPATRTTRPTSVAGFDADDFFAAADRPRASGRVSAPPRAAAAHTQSVDTTDSWAAWPNDNWAADDTWAKPTAAADAWGDSAKSDAWSGAKFDAWPESDRKTDNWATKTDSRADDADKWAGRTERKLNNTDSWANKSDSRGKTDNWAADWTDVNRNLNETWPASTLPTKKEKSPKPVKYAKSLVHTIGGIGRRKKTERSTTNVSPGAGTGTSADLPSEEAQWAWAAAESERLAREQRARRQQEDAELQLALALSRQER